MSESKPTLEEDIERVLARMESGNGYRSSPQVSPQLVVRLQNKLSQLYPAQAPASQDEAHLSERIKAIYPVIHRTYDAFIETKQGDVKVDVRKIRVRKGWFGEKKIRLSISDKYSRRGNYGVRIGADIGRKQLYCIFRLHPEWQNENDAWNIVTIKRREEGLGKPDESIDIHSRYFKIDCMPLEEFVKALCAGSSEPVLRQSTLDHISSLPEILGPYLDKKERGDLG